jgi:hypothetical protein
VHITSQMMRLRDLVPPHDFILSDNKHDPSHPPTPHSAPAVAHFPLRVPSQRLTSIIVMFSGALRKWPFETSSRVPTSSRSLPMRPRLAPDLSSSGNDLFFASVLQPEIEKRAVSLIAVMRNSKGFTSVAMFRQAWAVQPSPCYGNRST